VTRLDVTRLIARAGSTRGAAAAAGSGANALTYLPPFIVDPGVSDKTKYVVLSSVLKSETLIIEEQLTQG
jgi:hypothetical protein